MMKAERRRHIDATIRLLTAGTMSLLVLGQAAAQPPNATSSFQLGSGVVVDPARKSLYVMSPDGGIEAVGLVNGERFWNTKAASKPLGLSGNRLIGQAETPGQASAMTVLALNPATGQQLVSGSLPMPAGVRPTTTETARGKFLASAQPSGAEAVVTWTFIARPRKGIPPFAKEALQPAGTPPAGAPLPAAAPATPTVTSGAYRFNLTTGAAAPVAAPPPSLPLGMAALPVASGNRIPGLSEDQFLSADGRHVLESKLTGDDTVWDQYTLTVYNRATKQRVGQFKSHFALVPFFVAGSLVVFETPPYSRQTDAGAVDEPLKIRAVNLQSGMEAWSKAIRDTTYRGPYPS